MTEKGFSFWNDEWMEVQRKYWDNWTNLSRQAQGDKAADTIPNPWAAAMEHWWKAVAPSMQPPTQDFLGKLIQQGTSFFHLAESCGKGVESTTAACEAIAKWQETLGKTFDGLKDAVANTGQSTSDAMHRMMAFWELPLDTWERLGPSLSMLPGDPFQTLQSKGMDQITDSVHTGIHRFLSTPGLGYTREHQELLQRGAQLWLDYQRVLQDYNNAFAKMGNQAVDRLRKKLLENGTEGQPVTTVRDLYALWVDACEEVYAEQVATDDYSALYGELVNAMMALKRHVGLMMDEGLGALNMPTRTEIDTLQERLQEARRQNRRLRADVDELKERVDQLGSQATAEPSAPARPSATRSTRRTAPRTTKKKAPAAAKSAPSSEK